MGMGDADFGRHERKIKMVGAAATSSVRSLQSLIVLGRGKIISCNQYGRRALGMRGMGNDGLF